MTTGSAPCVALAGEVGAGKSQLCHRLKHWLRQEPLKEWPGLTPLDTPGLCAAGPLTAGERAAQAQALAAVAQAPLLLHILDASRPALYQAGANLSPLDAALLRWGKARGGYVAVAAKMDRPGARAGLLTLRRHLADVPLVAVSALCSTGWAELRGSLRQVAPGR